MDIFSQTCQKCKVIKNVDRFSAWKDNEYEKMLVIQNEVRRGVDSSGHLIKDETHLLRSTNKFLNIVKEFRSVYQNVGWSNILI